MTYLELKTAFLSLADENQSKDMAAYMRNRFVFYGLKNPVRKTVYSDFLKQAKRDKSIDWASLDECWADPHREFHYFVCDYLLALTKNLTFEDVPRVERYIRSNQWWDTVDALDGVIGEIGLRDDRVASLMLSWSMDPDFWIRRVAINHQLSYKAKTNSELLGQIIRNNLGSDEFFINKAIGWSLREYSKTNPEWVGDFIIEFRDQLTPLSIREGSKYLG